MIVNIVKNIFDVDLDVLVHQANCFCTMRSGIAKEIARRYPEAAQVDSLTRRGDMAKLGSYTVAHIPGGANTKHVVNLYSQHGYDSDAHRRKTDYNAMYDGLSLMRDNLVNEGKGNYKVGVPHKIGCGLGGGKWPIVKAIIECVFDQTEFTVIICQRPEEFNADQRTIKAV